MTLQYNKDTRAELRPNRHRQRALHLASPLLALALFGWLYGAGTDIQSKAGGLSPAELEASALCLDCHDNYDQSLAHTAHAVGKSQSATDVHCASCHSGAATHVGDPSRENIGNPALMEVGDLNSLCSDCHRPHVAQDNIGLDPHLNQGLSCIDCHSAHDGQEGLLSADVATLCESCHQGVTLQFQSRSNHPVGDGVVNCTSCHSFSGATEPDFGHGVGANCYSCHPEQSGPHLFEHPVTVSFATEGEGCTSCHFGHGGPNERLLKSPDNNLCQSCHGTPPLHRSKHSGLGAKLNCVDCHSQTHGSNDNRLMLDPDLGSKMFPNCYQSGCHSLGN